MVKDAVPNDAQDFGFRAAASSSVAPDSRFPTSFTLDDDPISAMPNFKSWEQMAPGTYVITEDALPAGWSLEDISLSPTSTGSTLDKDLTARKATVVLHDNADATVTFKNTKARALTLQKQWVNGLEGDSTTLTIDGKPVNPAVVSTVAKVPSFTDTLNTVTASVQPGAQVTVSEVLRADNKGGYSPSLSLHVRWAAIRHQWYDRSYFRHAARRCGVYVQEHPHRGQGEVAEAVGRCGQG